MIYRGHFPTAKHMKLLQLKTFERFELLLTRLLALTPARSYAFAMLARLKAEGTSLQGVDLERAAAGAEAVGAVRADAKSGGGVVAA